MLDVSSEDLISTEEALRLLVPEPSARALSKQSDRLDKISQEFVEKSPFMLLATSDCEGRTDVTPRGDPAGFVKVVDETTLLIPERIGNNRLDSLSNLLKHPSVGLLFLIPGVGHTLRVNGSARILKDKTLLASMAHREKPPVVVIEVSIEEVFSHCPKALIRSGLWDPSLFVDPATVPSLGKMVAQVVDASLGEEAIKKYDEFLDKDVADRLY